MNGLSPAEIEAAEDVDYLGEAAERIAAARRVSFTEAVALVEAALTPPPGAPMPDRTRARLPERRG